MSLKAVLLKLSHTNYESNSKNVKSLKVGATKKNEASKRKN